MSAVLGICYHGPMIKAFLFDYDGVISNGVKLEWIASRLSDKLEVPTEMTLTWIQEIWNDFLKGTISEDEIWHQFEDKYGKPINIHQRDIWFQWQEIEPVPNMIDLVRFLRKKGYAVGLLSNVTSRSKKIIEAKRVYDEFNFIVASCELGYKKPDPEIFQIALEKMGSIKSKDVVFIDDRKANINAAERLGFKCILVKNHQNVISEVMSLVDTPSTSVIR